MRRRGGLRPGRARGSAAACGGRGAGRSARPAPPRVAGRPPPPRGCRGRALRSEQAPPGSRRLAPDERSGAGVGPGRPRALLAPPLAGVGGKLRGSAGKGAGSEGPRPGSAVLVLSLWGLGG